ncbi:Uncharacterized protein FWK35_00033056, partial [Aphis craccivora]
QKQKNKIIIIDFEFINYQRTDLILISAAISQTHVKSEIKRLRGQPLIISPAGRIRLMNNYSYIKTEDLLLKMFEKKPDQLHFILNELHLAMKTKTLNLTTNFLKNYLDFNNQNAIILLWNGNSDKPLRTINAIQTCFHLSLSCAIVSPYRIPISAKFFSTLSIHLCFGLPGGLFPWGFHFKTSFIRPFT